MGTVSLVVEGPFARVTLSHPGKFNAMSRAMWRELKAMFDTLSARGSLRCMILAGESGHFCAGGDISEYPVFRFDEAALHGFHENEAYRCAPTAEHREGAAAFLAKRPPIF